MLPTDIVFPLADPANRDSWATRPYAPWVAGDYPSGSVVSFAGALWIALSTTDATPGVDGSWLRLLQDIVATSGTLFPIGVWNAAINSPPLSPSGVAGHVLRVAVAGATPLGGIVEWRINDLAIFLDGLWRKVPNEIPVVADQLDITLFGQSLIESEDAADARGALGLGPLATATQVPKAQAALGNWVWLATLVASDSPSLSDVTHFSADHDEYEIVFENILAATDDVDFQMQVHSGGEFQTADYVAGAGILGAAYDFESPTTHIPISGDGGRVSNAANKGLSGSLRINGVNGGGHKKIRGGAINSAPGAVSNIQFAGEWTGGTGAVTGVRFQMSSGNIASGKIHIFGRKQ
jgi:hypothetical protein